MSELERTSFSLLPPGAHPCVWMAARVLRFRLCERGLRCDDCPLDQALRGPSTATSAAAHGAGPPQEATERAFPNDRRYLRGHLWVMARAPNLLRLGIDSFAARSLGPLAAVEYPWRASQQPTLEAGVTLARLHLRGGSLEVHAPCRVWVVATNPALARCPELVVSDPYGAGWLAELGPSEGAEPSRLGFEAERMRSLALADEHALREAIVSLYAHRACSRVDGGALADRAAEQVGASRYLALLGGLVG